MGRNGHLAYKVGRPFQDRWSCGGCATHPVACRILLLLNEEWVHVITEEEGGGFRSVPLDESKSTTPLVESKARDD
jgi:hypothetical protein